MAGEERSFPLLDSLSSVFTTREIERKKQLEVIKDKEECNKVHVQYLKDNVISKQDYDRAATVVKEWSKINGNVSKESLRMLKNKRKTDLIPLSIGTIKRRRLGNSPSHQRYQAIEQSSNHNSDYLESAVVCEIVNCGIVFDSRLEFEKHNAGFKHSPCNPYKHLPNGKLINFPLLYSCPNCTAQFQKKLDCQEHMIFKDHLPVLSPVAVYGYMCPQCCMIFHSIVKCHTHMSQTNHYNVTYSFSQDTSEDSTGTKSILISGYLASQFYTKCLTKDYTVNCVTCKIEVNDVIFKHQHTLSTGHQEYSTYSTSITDEVFGEFLSDKSCDNCGKIIWNGDIEKGFHACTSNEIGFLKDNDCATFREFVHRCGIKEDIGENDFDASVQNINHDQRLGASSTNSLSPVIAVNSSLGAVGGVDPVNESEASVILLDTPDIGNAEKFLYGSDASLIISDTTPADIWDFSKLRTESVMIVDKPSFGDNVDVCTKENHVPVQSDDKDDLDYLSIGDSSDYDSEDSDIVFTGSEECKPSVSNWVWNSKPDKVETTSRTVTRSSMSPSKKVIQISKQLTESSTFSLSKPTNSNDTASATEAKAIPSPNDSNVFNNAHEQEVKKLSKKARYRLKKKLEREKRLLLESENVSDSKPSSSKVSHSPVLKQSRDRSRSRSRSRSKSPHKPSGNDSQENSRKHLPKKKSFRNTRETNLRNNPRCSFESSDGDISTENLSKMHLLIFLDLDNWTGFFKRLPQSLPNKTFVWTFYGGNTSWKEPKALPFLKLKKDGCFYLHSQCGKTKDAADFAICFTKNLTGYDAECGNSSDEDDKALYRVILISCGITPCTDHPSHSRSQSLRHIRVRFSGITGTMGIRRKVWMAQIADRSVPDKHKKIGKMDDRLPKHVPFAILSGDRGFCEIENQMKNSSRRTVVIDPHEAVKSSEHMLYTMILSVMHS